MAHAPDDHVDYNEEEGEEKSDTDAANANVKRDGQDANRGFHGFLLKPELLRALDNLGYQHPSEGSTLIPPPLSLSLSPLSLFLSLSLSLSRALSLSLSLFLSLLSLSLSLSFCVCDGAHVLCALRV
jgi:hypothetical protein